MEKEELKKVIGGELQYWSLERVDDYKPLIEALVKKIYNKFSKPPKITIHKKVINENRTCYYFTKSRWKCLMVVYEESKDYGRNSTSSTEVEINIHYKNSWVKTNLIEIEEKEVPQAIKDILTYLK